MSCGTNKDHKLLVNFIYTYTNLQNQTIGPLRASYFTPSKYTVCWPINYMTGHCLTDKEVTTAFKYLGFMELYRCLAIARRMKNEM